MNSVMLILWVEEKLIPLFERLYPGKKMILIANNAAYHHKWIIGTLATSITKKIG